MSAVQFDRFEVCPAQRRGRIDRQVEERMHHTGHCIVRWLLIVASDTT